LEGERQCFIEYYADNDPLRSKHIAVKISKKKDILTDFRPIHKIAKSEY